MVASGDLLLSINELLPTIVSDHVICCMCVLVNDHVIHCMCYLRRPRDYFNKSGVHCSTVNHCNYYDDVLYIGTGSL